MEKDKRDILKGEELDDLHINTAMSLLQKNFPIVIQPPSLMNAAGFDYCPMETIQPVHNGAYHWLLLSSMKGVVSIYDSLNMTPTNILLKQISQLFSPDDTVPPYVQHKCYKQVGSTDCGIFAIAFAIDLLHGNEPHKVVYEQRRMREHLVKCYEVGKLSPFPKYRANDQTADVVSKNDPKPSEDTWSTPKKYLLRSRHKSNNTMKETTLQNRFAALANMKGKSSKSSSQTNSIESDRKKSATSKTKDDSDANKHQVSETVQ